jgi:hypothetical protein
MISYMQLETQGRGTWRPAAIARPRNGMRSKLDGVLTLVLCIQPTVDADLELGSFMCPIFSLRAQVSSGDNCTTGTPRNWDDDYESLTLFFSIASHDRGTTVIRHQPPTSQIFVNTTCQGDAEETEWSTSAETLDPTPAHLNKRRQG